MKPFILCNRRCSSIALNRVIGTDPSVILGHLQSNGRIFLLNPNGILFGAGAQIDVGGLLATTLQIRNDDFMAGRYLFAQDPLKGLHTVINRGTIQVSDHGFVFLAAPGVSNEGLIVATLGKVVLGSGQTLTIDLMGDGLINYALSGKVLDQVMGVDGKPLSSAVSNTGTIQADGGHVILQAKASGDIFSSVVNQSGVIRARSLESHGGVVQLLGGDETLVAATAAGAMRPAGDVSGAVVNTGTIDVAATQAGGASGSVQMVGERVGQFGSIMATGAEGANGGDVVIASTTRTLLASGSTIDISGIGHSSGGRLRVWSDHDTFFDSRSDHPCPRRRTGRQRRICRTLRQGKPGLRWNGQRAGAVRQRGYATARSSQHYDRRGRRCALQPGCEQSVRQQPRRHNHNYTGEHQWPTGERRPPSQ